MSLISSGPARQFGNPSWQISSARPLVSAKYAGKLFSGSIGPKEASAADADGAIAAMVPRTTAVAATPADHRFRPECDEVDAGRTSGPARWRPDAAEVRTSAVPLSDPLRRIRGIALAPFEDGALCSERHIRPDPRHGAVSPGNTVREKGPVSIPNGQAAVSPNWG